MTWLNIDANLSSIDCRGVSHDWATVELSPPRLPPNQGFSTEYRLPSETLKVPCHI
jgi:hypothetical protein